jgi:integrase
MPVRFAAQERRRKSRKVPNASVLRQAVDEWDWISKAPRVRMLPEPKRRIRWLTRDEADREQVGKHKTHVFSYRGNPVRQVHTKAWRAALKRVGIEDFRWHGLRHIWASWHAQAGTPLHALQELGGWECVEMVRKCAHLARIISCNTRTACQTCGSCTMGKWPATY